jgi:tetratricopeptide (TPR) repeat protein
VDSVAPGGTITIFTGEAEPNLYNHPLVMEAMARAARSADAFSEHSKRGARMVGLRRYQDAVYDFQYAEFLADRMGFKVGKVRRMAPEVREHLNPPLGDMFGRFGFTLMVLGQLEQARPRLVRALGHNPRQNFVNGNLAGCLRMLGEPAELVAKYYQKELRINPSHPTVAEDLASIKGR